MHMIVIDRGTGIEFSQCGAPQPAGCKILGIFFLEIFVCTRFSGV
eukprot:SAG11_NODE_28434_length_321_cov_1.833333_1_plen_44_part_01